MRGSLSGTPLLNTALLGLGAVLANFIGTTGASVLLIRPLLRANAPRVNKHARRRLLHLRRVELRRPADAARRSAALPGLPEGRPVRMDPPALEGMAARERAPARDLQRLGPDRVRARGGRAPGLAARRGDAARAARASMGGATSCSWAPWWRRSSPPATGSGARGAGWPFGVQEALLLGIAVAAYLATPARLPRGQRLRLRPDHRGRRPVRRDLRHDGARPAAAQRERGALRPRASVAVLLGLGAALELPRQRAHLSDVRRHRLRHRRHRARRQLPEGAARARPRGGEESSPRSRAAP